MSNTATAVMSSQTATAARPQPWIISRYDDLLWFQGSVFVGVALLLFFWLEPGLDTTNYNALNPVVLVLLLWGVLFDGTHVWGTYARSYRVADPASRAALPSRWSWAIIGVGPLVALVDYALLPASPSQLSSAGWLFRTFLMFAYLWAYWHLVRQHYGFLVLYRRKAGEHDRRGGRVDALLLWTGTLYPYLRFSLGDAYLTSGLPQLMPAEWLAPARMMLDISFAVIMVGTIALVLSGRIEKPRLGPKHLLLAVVIGFTFAVFSLLDNLLTITATLTIFHNLQYHRIVWQYERGNGRTPSGSMLAYLTLGLALGLVWYMPRVLGVALVQGSLARNVLLGLGWGVAFHHYLVDARIWRVRRSPGVAQAIDAGAVKA
jgi:hypothetical protein